MQLCVLKLVSVLIFVSVLMFVSVYVGKGKVMECDSSKQ